MGSRKREGGMKVWGEGKREVMAPAKAFTHVTSLCPAELAKDPTTHTGFILIILTIYHAHIILVKFLQSYLPFLSRFPGFSFFWLHRPQVSYIVYSNSPSCPQENTSGLCQVNLLTELYCHIILLSSSLDWCSGHWWPS